ncbi:hypothetical protein GCM10027445_50400 [Amycolatopsis endophytica]|uniref:Transcriptional regulator WhiB n=1 Tax=Amycolatopsis endophytica TaxID=860233 RepID=A0A853AZ39_9PSEU|nr:WhiB family transcriptional regulator [Amycolatopsis endophytica]NYI87887.1 WhiB family redox-sensing transcriptional regulator [Amycolatopsis endophytica]
MPTPRTDFDRPFRGLTATMVPRRPRTPAVSWGDLDVSRNELAWRAQAACRDDRAPQVFFPEQGGRAAKTVARAKQRCTGCPVRAECLNYALARREGFGIWGGLTAHERRALLRGRRARRKSAHRDREVARLTRAGLTAREIGQQLGITPRTVVRSRSRARLNHEPGDRKES